MATSAASTRASFCGLPTLSAAASPPISTDAIVGFEQLQEHALSRIVTNAANLGSNGYSASRKTDAPSRTAWQRNQFTGRSTAGSPEMQILARRVASVAQSNATDGEAGRWLGGRPFVGAELARVQGTTATAGSGTCAGVLVAPAGNAVCSCGGLAGCVVCCYTGNTDPCRESAGGWPACGKFI